ncbi:MAG: glycosyltransferase [Planctomycetes bacterium]|nr:glycosyltransferase [Planctomycetota bacterium]
MLVIATLDPAGAERQLVGLATHLDRRRFKPLVCCLTRGGPLEADLKAAGIECRVLHKRFKLDFGVLFKLVRLMREFQPEIVHTWMFTANAFGRTAAMLTGCRAIVAAERVADPLKPWHQRVIDRVLARHTGRIIANADAVRQFCVQEVGLPPDKVIVIKNGIDVSRFSAPPPAGLRAQLGLPPGAAVLGTIGRLAEQKGIEYGLRAAALLKGHARPFVWLIVGEGEAEPGLRHLADELQLGDCVRFLGYRADIPNLLALLDVLVLPSLWEGLPNVVMEAMASAKPVVATDAGGTRELVADGVTGFLVPSKNPEALAEKIHHLLAHPDDARRMGQEGRAVIEKTYSFAAAAQATAQVYDGLLASK